MARSAPRSGSLALGTLAPRAPAAAERSAVATAAEARVAVERWAERGYAWIRIRGPIDADVLAAVIDAAHARGLSVAGRVGPTRAA